MDERNILVHELLVMIRDLCRAVRTDFVVRNDTESVGDIDKALTVVEKLKERVEMPGSVKVVESKGATTSDT